MEDVLKEVSLMQRWSCEELELARYLESHEGVNDTRLAFALKTANNCKTGKTIWDNCLQTLDSR